MSTEQSSIHPNITEQSVDSTDRKYQEHDTQSVIGNYMLNCYTRFKFIIQRVLIPYIHNSILLNVILEKRCIKFLWTLFNTIVTYYSAYDLYRTTIKYSLHNRNTTLGENVRFFMHKFALFLLIDLKISIYCITR